MHAIASAFGTLSTRDPRVAASSRSYYATALQVQRMDLARLQPVMTPANESVLSKIKTDYKEKLVIFLVRSMLLTEFEIMQPLMNFSFWNHAFAAGRMLEILGPESCIESPVHQLFLLLRFQKAYIALAGDTPTFLGTLPWITIPFSAYPKGDHDVLFDILLEITQVRTDKWTQDGSTRAESLNELNRLLEKLDIYHKKIKDNMITNGFESPHDFNLIDILRSIACLAIARKMALLVPDEKSPTDIDIDEHCRFIISCAPYISTAATFSRQLHIMFAIHLASIYAESEEVRHHALEEFTAWQQSLTAVNS
ncbi:hypothetical protein NA57DRAFT_73878 [Rhizodiscina lignyota]|uniref:Uncharacterized protein n=1 Tax=Rhizodiscina lignyota TaxID=1504668 RepID=A0A9P4IIJ0_9PEZI|nr:hypothetical protein NA57DRAFT_73878 [Rhizodiscina lignyota]